MNQRITVILPVYNAAHTLNDCLLSLLNNKGDFDVLIIDDASTDVTVLPFLKAFVERNKLTWQLLNNSQNLGFVKTVNNGMARCASDVVLLNQDVILTSTTLEELSAVAAVQQDLATLTPLSNNAEICSIPDICKNNPMPQDIELLGHICKQVDNPIYPEVPTGVGYCMYITRSALDELGTFDEAAFGHGYGEENDFCCRAKMAGLYNRICDTGYAAHIGNQSFSELGMQPNPQALGIINQRYPWYTDAVQSFIQNDPLADRRKAIYNRYQDQLKQREFNDY